MTTIIAGKYKGKRLYTPKDTKTIRTASSRFKQGIFETLKFALINADVLDLYAGIGSLGLEALSRGANSCDFVDQSKESHALLYQNIKLCNAEDDCQVYTSSVEDFVLAQNTTDFKYDIIFIDPPYSVKDKDKIEDLIYNSSCLLNDKGILVFKHSYFVNPPPKIEGIHGLLELDIQKKYSISVASIYFFTSKNEKNN